MILHGKVANVYWDAQAGPAREEIDHGQSWTCDITADVAETTAFQDTWATYAGGFTGWTATVTCNADAANLQIGLESASDPNELGDVAANLELYVQYAANLYKMLWGPAIYTGASLTTDKDDVLKVVFSFQGTTALAWYADTVVKVYA